MDFKIKLKGNFDDLPSARVGILDKSARGRSPTDAKYTLNLGGESSTANTPSSKRTGKLTEAMDNLEKSRGVLSEALLHASKRDVEKVATLFIKTGSGDNQARAQLLRECVDLVRSPILRGEYGGNSKATQEEKGFNKFGINTGTLVKNIKARLV